MTRKKGKGRPGRRDAPVTQVLVDDMGKTMHLALMAFDIGHGHFDAFRDLYQTFSIVREAATGQGVANADVDELGAALDTLGEVWERCEPTGHWQLADGEGKILAGACIAAQEVMKRVTVLALATSYHAFCERQRVLASS